MKLSSISEKPSSACARACIAWCIACAAAAAQATGSAPPAAPGPPPAAESTAPAPAASATPAGDAPLAFPPLEHYAKLWESSMFTTKALPPLESDGPKGPVFTDSLTLAGTYEVDGAFVAVLLDKTTSIVTEARIGSENEAGIKVMKVSPGSTPDKARVQLQKGVESGWVAMTELPSGGGGEPAPSAAMPTRPGAPGGKNGPPGVNVPPVQVPPPSVRQPQPAPVVPQPIVPVPQPVPVTAPGAGGADDLPLPPP